MRQFSCIELTLTDALIVRDAIRPLARVEPLDPGSAIAFCEKLYDAILKMKAESLDAVNIPLDDREALVINHYIGSEDWQGALGLLEQTWLVLYERRNQRAYPRPKEEAAAVLRRLASNAATER